MKRGSGVLLHITSLPSQEGIGTLGREAYKFADFLKAAGQSYWQVLPAGPTGFGESPYQSYSSGAGNPLFIDLETLREDGLLNKEELEGIFWGADPSQVDFDLVRKEKMPLLYLAFQRGWQRDQEQVSHFAWENRSWLPDYALYMAVKEHFGGVSWMEWEDEEIKLRRRSALEQYAQMLQEKVNYYVYEQYLFFTQWNKLKAYVNGQGIQIIGDIPIYVALDSADTWANPQVFWLDEELKPMCVAGCPPDYFSPTGQLWGNPLYRWDYLKNTGFRWWIERVAGVMKLYDVLRIDHFRGFEAYYAIPYGEPTAEHGSWIKGPNMALFDAIKKELGDLPIIAEDLGFLTPEVHQMLKASGYPGMKVLQFAFDSDEHNSYLPHQYERNSVVYIGTHDNDTLKGWMDTASDYSRKFAKAYLNLTEEEGYHMGFLRATYGSVADLAVVQMQDLLYLGTEARMNTPSTIGCNWKWRLVPGQIPEKLPLRLHAMCKMFARIN